MEATIKITLILSLSAIFFSTQATYLADPLMLQVAPGSVSSQSLTLIWGDGDPMPENEYYAIYQDNKLTDTSRHCYYRPRGLNPDHLYTFHIERKYLKKTTQRSNIIAVRTKTKQDTLSITAFGAVGDGRTNNTAAIQEAINACPSNGLVYIPTGIFLSGAIFVKSNMTLFLEKGAILKAIPKIDLFPIVEGSFEGIEGKQFASLINGGDLHNKGIQDFAIRGEGTIDAEGHTLIKLEEDDPENAKRGKRGRIISINNGENIHLEGVRFLESPAWGVHLVYCYGVSIEHIYVNTNYDVETGESYLVHNGDGIALSSSKNVYIFDNTISSQDDNISIKSGKNEDGWRVAKSTEHIRVFDCHFSDGFGVVVGSEMSGNIRNVIVNNCTYKNTAQVAQLKTTGQRGRTIENITFKNLSLYDTVHTDSKWFRGGICIDAYYGEDNPNFAELIPPTEQTPTIQDIWFSNITIYRKNGRAAYLCGRPERYLKNIHFQNVQIEAPQGLESRFVNGITLRNVNITVPKQEKPYQWYHTNAIVQESSN